MREDIAALLLTLAELAELRGQLAAAQDILMETTIDAGRLHARIEFLRAEHDTGLCKAKPAVRRQVRRP